MTFTSNTNTAHLPNGPTTAATMTVASLSHDLRCRAASSLPPRPNASGICDPRSTHARTASRTPSRAERSARAGAPPRARISETRGARADARLRQKKDGSEAVSSEESSGSRKAVADSSAEAEEGGSGSWAGCGGMATAPSRTCRATMFWQRAESSRSVRSSVGRAASERERAAREDLSAACR